MKKEIKSIDNNTTEEITREWKHKDIKMRFLEIFLCFICIVISILLVQLLDSFKGDIVAYCPAIGGLHILLVDTHIVWLLFVLMGIICIDEAKRNRCAWSILLSCTSILVFRFVCCEDDVLIYILSALVFLLSCFSAARSLIVKKIRYRSVEDCLGRWKFYDEILDKIKIVAHDGDNGASIIINGSWGTGKSHCLSYIRSQLTRNEQTPFRVCNVDLWQMKDSAEAFSNIAKSIERAITGQGGQSNLVTRAVLWILQTILPFQIIDPSLYDELMCLICNNDIDGDRKICAKISSLTKKECGESGVLLILDNIERAKSKVIIELLPLIEKLRSINKLIILCAVDVEPLRERCKANDLTLSSSNIEGYFLKIFDYHFSVPEIDAESMNRMFIMELKKNGASERLIQRVQFLQLYFDTPRQIQRVASHVSYIDRSFLANLESERDTYFDEKSSEIYSFFNNEWKDSGYEYSAILAVSILALMYPSVLTDIKSYADISKFTHDFLPSQYNHLERADVINAFATNCNVSNEQISNHKNWKSEHPVTDKIVSSEILAWSVMSYLKYISPKKYLYAVGQYYARQDIIPISDVELIISGIRSIKSESFIDFFMHKLAEKRPSNINESLKFLMAYASHHHNQRPEAIETIRSLQKLILSDCKVEMLNASYLCDDLKRYLKSQRFLFPFVFNMASFTGVDNLKLISLILHDVVDTMTFPELATFLNNIINSRLSGGKRFEVRYIDSGAYVDARPYILSPVFVDFCNYLFYRYYSLFVDCIEEDSLMSHINQFCSYYILYPIDELSDDLIVDARICSRLTSVSSLVPKLRNTIALFSIEKMIRPEHSCRYSVASKSKFQIAKLLIDKVLSEKIYTSWSQHDVSSLVATTDASLSSLSAFLKSEYYLSHVPDFEFQQPSLELLQKFRASLLQCQVDAASDDNNV